MSARELPRVVMLGRVQAQTLSVVEAVPLLGVGYQQAKRLWRRFRQDGARAAATAATEVHRRAPAARVLGQIFRLDSTRIVGADRAVRHHNRVLQIARQRRYPTVRVCEWADGRLAIEYRGRVLTWAEVPAGRACCPCHAPQRRPPPPCTTGRRPAPADHP